MVELASGTHLDRFGMWSFGVHVIPGYFRLNLVLNPGIIKQVTNPTLPPQNPLYRQLRYMYAF